MPDEFVDAVLKFRSNWKDLLELNAKSDNKEALKVLWVWPSENNLKFLKETLLNCNIQGITSLGCGCGLLEWILQEYIGFPVIGYEINREWWESKYSIPPFIPLRYAEKDAMVEFNPKYALLFCYFNNGPAFRKYVKNYRGNMIIIIGPADGSGRHTDPQPFTADFGDINWCLIAHQEVKNTKDFIAVFVRRQEFI